jgi:hypothetical protein
MTTQYEFESRTLQCPEGESVLVRDRHQIQRAGGRMTNKMTYRVLNCVQSDGEESLVSERPPWLCESCTLYGKIRSVP